MSWNPYKDPSPYHSAEEINQGRAGKYQNGDSKSWPKIGIYIFCIPIQPTIHHENITSAVFEKCCNFYWPSRQQGMRWATELCPNRIRTSKHQTMCHHLSDLWHCGCRLKRFCHCLACQLPCFCSWFIFESMEAHCCFGVCKYPCPSEIQDHYASPCCGVLLSFTELAIYSAPARDRAEWLNRPTQWIFNFTQESFQTIHEVRSKQCITVVY